MSDPLLPQSQALANYLMDSTGAATVAHDINKDGLINAADHDGTGFAAQCRLDLPALRTQLAAMVDPVVRRFDLNGSGGLDASENMRLQDSLEGIVKRLPKIDIFISKVAELDSLSAGNAPDGTPNQPITNETILAEFREAIGKLQRSPFLSGPGINPDSAPATYAVPIAKIAPGR